MAYKQKTRPLYKRQGTQSQKSGNKKNYTDRRKPNTSSLRYADENRFDATDPYSMIPNNMPPRKRIKNRSGGSMEGVFGLNDEFAKSKKLDGRRQNNHKAKSYTRDEAKGYNKQRNDKSNDKYTQNKNSRKPRYNERKDNNRIYDNKRTEDVKNEELNDGTLLTGRNPIREALKAGRDLEKILVQAGDMQGSARQILAMAKDAGVRIQPVNKKQLDMLASNHQGMVAFASAYEYSIVDDILELAKQRGEKPFIMLLDSITDPHNLGAIIRSAACTGAHGVIIPRHRAVGLTNVVAKASAGAIEHIKVARVTNLADTIINLKKQGVWTYALDMGGETYSEADFTSATALVIGSEGFGVSRRVKDECDKVISIPMTGEIGSFNASVAAGIIMHQVYCARIV